MYILIQAVFVAAFAVDILTLPTPVLIVVLFVFVVDIVDATPALSPLAMHWTAVIVPAGKLAAPAEVICIKTVPVLGFELEAAA